MSDDFRFCRVTLKSRWWNKNANRTQFGGSMFAMTDPIYPLMLMGYFKNRYYVWDKAGSINYIKPGKGAGGRIHPHRRQAGRHRGGD